MAEVTKPIKVGNYWTNLVDSESGESVNYEQTLTWIDGTPMSDVLCDGVVYRKLPSSVGGGYVKRVITDGLINVKWFGASAAPNNDSTEAIQGAVNLALSLSVVSSYGTNWGVLIPKENYGSQGYNITDTIHVPGNIDFLMEGRCRYIGDQDRVAVEIGEPGVNNRGCTYKLNVAALRTSDWANPNFVGVRLINCDQCRIEVELIDGFYKGLECMGDGQGFAYNQTHIKIINSNKYGIYLDYNFDTNGWCNENIFYGGRFSTTSGFNQGQGRVGIRVTGDDNRFVFPSFELDRGTSNPEQSQAAIFEDAYNCQILGCRNEGNSNTAQNPSGYSFEMRGASKENYVEVAYAFNRERSREVTCFLDTSDTKQNIYKSMQNMYVDAMFGRTVYDSENLSDKFTYYSDTNAGLIPGLLFAHRTTGDLTPMTPTGETARIVDVGRGAEVEINRTGFAIWLNTTQSKKFSLIRNGHPSRAGRVGLKFYDESGVEITDEDNPGIDTQNTNLSTNQEFIYSTFYGGCFLTGSPASITRSVYFSVKPEVARVLLIIGNPNSFTTLSSFQILSLDNSGRGFSAQGTRQSRIGSDGLKRWNYQGLPTDGTYSTGELYFERSPDIGRALIKLCNDTGTSRAINETGDYTSGTTITGVSDISQFSIGDAITVDGSPRRIITGLDTGNNSLTLDSSSGLNPGTGLTIENYPPSFREGAFLGLSKAGGMLPEGVETGIVGAIYHHISTGAVTHPLFVKTEPGGDEGWKYLLTEDDIPPTATTSDKGVVNQSAASADSASAISAAFDQAEVQAILDELRDLKTKMRTAGLLAT